VGLRDNGGLLIHSEPVRTDRFLFVLLALEAPQLHQKPFICSPWQNGVAERWVGSCRRDLLDHIIAVDECHLKRRLSEYIRYVEFSTTIRKIHS
jgi:hypothetical protein